MTQITDAMIETFQRTLRGVQKIPGYGTYIPSSEVRLALEAALAVAPDPAPDEAFAGAVSRFGVLAEDVGTVRTSIWSRLPESEKGREAPPELVAAIEEREAARQRILALHRQATHAGLRKLREWIDLVDVDAETPLNVSDTWKQGFQFGFGLALNVSTEQIDALLKEATDG
jgi:hypothetical protein